jgi:uncharacterized protein YbjT (DUF2867 family)
VSDAPGPPPTPSGGRPLLLLTGATGYVGGRLLPRLEASGRRVRCMTRRPEQMEPRVAPGTEVVAGDVGDPGSLRAAMEGVDTAYYLVHSMSGAADYREADRAGAEAFGAAAREAGVRRIVYLGGLGHGENLSGHLASRQEVGRTLAASGVPTLELRAAIIIGSGSISFEMIRALVDRLPVMITPRWVTTRTQPIAVDDAVSYLAAASDLDIQADREIQIGGPDVTTYGGMIDQLARALGRRPPFRITVPILTPHLSSLWIGLVTPVDAGVAQPLIEGLATETVVGDESGMALFPGVTKTPLQEALRQAAAGLARN